MTDEFPPGPKTTIEAAALPERPLGEGALGFRVDEDGNDLIESLGPGIEGDDILLFVDPIDGVSKEVVWHKGEWMKSIWVAP